jgi:uracil phosphoribosyltransferase
MATSFTQIAGLKVGLNVVLVDPVRATGSTIIWLIVKE